MPAVIIPSRWRDIKPPLGSQVDWGHSLSQGLIGCWLMNEGGGRKVNDLVNKIKGTLTNTVLWLPNQKGINPKFDAASSVINCGTPKKLNNIIPITIVALFCKTANNATSQYPVIVDKLGTNIGWKFGINQTDVTSNCFIFGAYSSTPAFIQILSSAESVVLNKFSFVVVTWGGITNSTNMHLYIDGKLNDAFPTGSGGNLTDDSTINLGIGSRVGVVRSVGGYISLVYIYNRVFSSSEIRALYEAPYQFIEPQRRIFVSAPAGGNQYYKTCTESLKLSDNYTRQAVYARTINEAVKFIDTCTRVNTWLRTLTDVLKFVDILTAGTVITGTYVHTMTEAIKFKDTLTKVPNKVLTESIKLMDTYTRVITALREFTETIKLQDEITKGMTQTLTELLKFNDLMFRWQKKTEISGTSWTEVSHSDIWTDINDKTTEWFDITDP